MTAGWRSAGRALLAWLAVVGPATWQHSANAAEYTLTWIDQAQDEDGFRIERKLGPMGPYLEIAVVGGGVTTFVDPAVDEGVINCYRVQAFNRFGNSGYSNEACAPLFVSFDITPLVQPGVVVEFSMGASNLGPERRVDVWFGVVLPPEWAAAFNCHGGPNAAIVLFEFTFTRLTPGCLSSTASEPGEPFVPGLVIPPGLPRTASPPLLRFVWPADLPPGAYTFFVGLTEPGGARPNEWLVLVGRTVISTER